MGIDHQYSIIMTASDSEAEAEALARSLVEQKLAACVQIVRITSFYRWEGQVERAGEFLLLIKTAHGMYEQVERFIAAQHSYDLPELVEVPITRGSAGYLGWIDDSTR